MSKKTKRGNERLAIGAELEDISKEILSSAHINSRHLYEERAEMSAPSGENAEEQPDYDPLLESAFEEIRVKYRKEAVNFTPATFDEETTLLDYFRASLPSIRKRLISHAENDANITAMFTTEEQRKIKRTNTLYLTASEEESRLLAYLRAMGEDVTREFNDMAEMSYIARKKAGILEDFSPCPPGRISAEIEDKKAMKTKGQPSPE